MTDRAESIIPVPPEEPPPRVEAGGALELLKVFRHRNYRLFFAGQLVSLMGSWITTVAQGWLVYRLSHSPFYLGLATFAGQVPVFFVAAFGGMIADRVDRRRLLVITQTLSMLESAALAVLTLLGVIQVWEIILLALFQGMVNAFDVPTRQAFTIEMVGREDLRFAISLNSMMFNLARILGPTVAGLIIAVAGEGVCFSIDAVSYAAVLTGLVLMHVPPRQAPPPGHPLQEIREGFRYTWTSPRLRNPILLVAACAAFGVSFMTLMPAVARDVLHSGSEGLGLLMGSVGAGALIGAYALARVPDRWLMLTPIAAAAGFGVAIILFAHSHILLLSMALLLPAAFGQMLLGGSTNTIIQTLSEDRFRGRVISFYTMSFMGMMPWGALLLGALAAHIGISETVTLGGAVCVVAAVTAYYAGDQRHLPSPAE